MFYLITKSQSFKSIKISHSYQLVSPIKEHFPPKVIFFFPCGKNFFRNLQLYTTKYIFQNSNTYVQSTASTCILKQIRTTFVLRGMVFGNNLGPLLWAQSSWTITKCDITTQSLGAVDYGLPLWCQHSFDTRSVGKIPNWRASPKMPCPFFSPPFSSIFDPRPWELTSHIL